MSGLAATFAQYCTIRYSIAIIRFRLSRARNIQYPWPHTNNTKQRSPLMTSISRAILPLCATAASGTSRFTLNCLTFVLALAAGCASNSNDGQDPALSVFNDPGTGQWQPVPASQLVDECGLDPDILATIDAAAPYSYAIARYGKLCHEFYRDDAPGINTLANNFSATKTLSAALFGRAVLLSQDLPNPLSDTDRMDYWVNDITFNPDAQIAHVLAMLGYNDSLAFGERTYAYDANGSREINRLSDVIEAVMAQDPTRFSNATTTGEFAQREFFDKLGMRMSQWTGESFASTWHSNLRDMLRLGVLLAHDGVWNQEQLVGADWVYKLSRPAFEDANTAYGYLTWLASNRNYYLPGIDLNFQQPLGNCQPPAIWREHPHGLSESMDCNYGDAAACIQTNDVGVFGGVGFGGQIVVVHKALDLVIVTRDAGGTAFLTTPWDMIRPALVAHDPQYPGDDDAFCAAYSSGNYAPDLHFMP